MQIMKNKKIFYLIRYFNHFKRQTENERLGNWTKFFLKQKFMWSPVNQSNERALHRLIQKH